VTVLLSSFPFGVERSDKNSKLNYMNSVFKVLELMQGRVKMICPECHQGMVQVHALSQMWEKGYKTIPCPRCNGSGIAYCCDGEDASCDAVTLFSDQSKTIEDTSLVA